MIEYSDDESSIENSENSDGSEIIQPSRSRQRALIDDIKENPELYATRRSERNRKEPSRYNILSEKVAHRSRLCQRLYSDSSTDNNNDDEEDSDFIYTKKSKKSNYRPKMEFRKRAHVSYKEALTSDDDDRDDGGGCDGNSDESGEPRKKSQKINGLANIRDNPLLNRPVNLIRRTTVTDCSDMINGGYGQYNVSEDINVIEEVLSSRLGRVGDTGNKFTFYNQHLRRCDTNNAYELGIDQQTQQQHVEQQFLIKWRGWSYIHSTWESETTLSRYPNLDGIKKFCSYKEVQKHRENWKKNHASPEDLDAAQFEEERNETLLQQKMECDRIIDAQRNRESDAIDYLVKWKTLDYRYSSWESGQLIMEPLYRDAIREFDERSRSVKIPNKKCEVLSRRPKFTPIREQPDYLSLSPELILRDYQLDGLNWLARSWTRGNSCILADEMGLGKTIQTISFLSYLFNEYAMYGPFLIVVPLSTISGWQTEFSNWAPYMNVVYYTGDALSRQIIRECEWYFPKKKMLKFHVCITTYELLLKDKIWLNQISWAFLGVDEAHRLKNDESQLYQALISFDTNCRLLITGTPVHNSLKELWALLHFIMPDRFDEWAYFEEKYNLSNENGAVSEVVNDLYKVLEPFLLRRIKKDVEKSLPSKSEQIIRVPMCRKQAELYKLILTKNYEALSKETRGHTSSFLNVVMELKKCCNHTQLVNPLDEETEQSMDPESRLRYFIKSSGKMMLLDKLLFELRDKGHRVLIFSQMVRMLDIISDYLVLRGWGFQRLDGSIKGSLRKQAIDHFNADGSTDFCFLLSTRAGGLGINLATADTVIIFDSDWNPQNDLQAMARAHRIGQTKQVSVYRFVIKSSVEEKIIECAKRKMVLDHLVIQRMDSALHRKTDANKNQPFNKDELNEILKFGASDLFNQDEQLDDEHELNIHDILQRAETRDNEEESHNPANELLSAFKVVNITETTEDEDIVYIGHKGKPRLWSEIVPQELRDKVKEEEHQKALLELELGPRQRKRVRAYQVGQVDFSSEESSEESDEKELNCQLNEKEIRAVLKVMRKFPRPLERVQSIMVEAEIIDRSEKQVFDLMKHVIDGCQNAVNECDSEEKKNKASFNIGKIVISSKGLLQSLEYLDILHYVLSKNKEERLKFQLPFETKLANWSCMWETEDDAKLLVGIYERGMDNWEAIKMDPNLKLTSKILPSSAAERPQSSHLRTRAEYLLKKLRDMKNKIKTEASGMKRSSKIIKPENVKKSKSKHKTGAIPVPKSAEFVESSDNSSKSSDNSKLKTKHKTKTAKKNRNSDKSKSKDDKIGNVTVTEDEAQFYEMRGALFDKCTKKMKPIKEQLKYLEDKQRRIGEKIKSDDKSLTNCLLSVGNHIRREISNFENEDEKRKWRNYLWSFVNFFFDVFPKEDLHRIYKNAYKKSSESKKSNRKHSSKVDGASRPLKTSGCGSNVTTVGGSVNNTGVTTTMISATMPSVVRPNFEAKSYHEYKLKMKRLKGEDHQPSTMIATGKSNTNVSSKYKPYDRPTSKDESSYVKTASSGTSSHHHHHHNKYHHDSDDDPHSHKPRKSSAVDDRSSSTFHTKSGANLTRDPRLSKPAIN